MERFFLPPNGYFLGTFFGKTGNYNFLETTLYQSIHFAFQSLFKNTSPPVLSVLTRKLSVGSCSASMRKRKKRNDPISTMEPVCSLSLFLFILSRLLYLKCLTFSQIQTLITRQVVLLIARKVALNPGMIIVYRWKKGPRSTRYLNFLMNKSPNANKSKTEKSVLQNNFEFTELPNKTKH